jgi:hypothetical protein
MISFEIKLVPEDADLLDEKIKADELNCRYVSEVSEMKETQDTLKDLSETLRGSKGRKRDKILNLRTDVTDNL